MKYPRDQHPWSEGEEGVLVRFFRTGTDASQLSDRHLRSPERIQDKLIELGWLATAEPTDEALNWLEEEYLAAPEIADQSNNDDEGAEEDVDDSVEPERASDEWTASRRGHLDDQQDSQRINNSDWGDSLDDFESGDWEHYSGGPDDDCVEQT